jgi:hypothetical protein
MIIAHIEGATRVCGESQGYRGLPLRDVMINCSVNGVIAAMETAWEPTPDELKRLNAGAKVYVRIIGEVPPPMLVTVGEAPNGHQG